MTKTRTHSSLLLLASLLGCGLAGCLEAPLPDDEWLEQIGEDLKVSDCASITPKPFPPSQSCPNPKDMTDNAKKAKCQEVKKVGLSGFKDAFGRDPDCSGGIVFGPAGLIDPCVQKNPKICRLKAPDAPSGTPGWPKNPYWNECLNDWWTFCAFNYPSEMGVGGTGEVCFAPGIDIDALPPDKVTSRELCQQVKDGKFPPPCKNLCES